MEGPASERERMNRVWGMVIAAFIGTILVITIVYLTFYVDVPEPHFVVGDRLDYTMSERASGSLTLEVTEVNGTEFNVTCIDWPSDSQYSQRMLFWYDGIDNETLAATFVGSDGMDTAVGGRMVDHYHYVSDDGTWVEDAYIGPDNGVVYVLESTHDGILIKYELTGSNVGWI